MLERETGLSLSLLKYLAEAERAPAAPPWIPMGQIAGALGIERGQAAKLARRLAALELVETRQGVTGGVALTNNGRVSDFAQVAAALGDGFVEGGCFLKRRPCDRASLCPMHASWTAARELLLASLRSERIADSPCALARRAERAAALASGPPTSRP